MGYKIYAVNCGCGCDMEYIGHTKQTLAERMRGHRATSKKGKSRFYEHMREMGTGFFIISLIEDLGEVSKEEAKKKENFYIIERETINRGWNSKTEDGAKQNIDMKECKHGQIWWKDCDICGAVSCANCGKKGKWGEINTHRLNRECYHLLKCGGCPALFQKKADKTYHERQCGGVREMLRKQNPDVYEINADYEKHLEYELEKEKTLELLRRYKKERNVYVSFVDFKKYLRLKKELQNEDGEKIGLCVFGW